jgi:hypothetical protein
MPAKNLALFYSYIFLQWSLKVRQELVRFCRVQVIKKTTSDYRWKKYNGVVGLSLSASRLWQMKHEGLFLPTLSCCIIFLSVVGGRFVGCVCMSVVVAMVLIVGCRCRWLLLVLGCWVSVVGYWLLIVGQLSVTFSIFGAQIPQSWKPNEIVDIPRRSGIVCFLCLKQKPVDTVHCLRSAVHNHKLRSSYIAR